MDPVRKPFQGTLNIIRFNWHFYVIAVAGLAISLLLFVRIVPEWKTSGTVLTVLFSLPILISLIVSWYIYDLSPLYKFQYLQRPDNMTGVCINIHAGFDETSILLQANAMCSELTVFDFYDPLKHTEISIKRARKAYPPFPGTQSITTDHIPCDDNSVDRIYLIFAAHEIRKGEERNIFFKELRRILKSSGDIIIIEHLRDGWNFMAYTLGFFHFLPRKLWLNQFKQSGFRIAKESRLNLFITCFILKKDGNPD